MKKLGTIAHWNIVISPHAQSRAVTRDIDVLQVTSAILALGYKQLKTYAKIKDDIAVIDTNNNFTVIFAVKATRIEIITLLDSANVWVKNGTEVKRI